MAVQKAVAERWKKITGVHADRRLRPHRDLARGTTNPPDLKEFNGSIGLPVPSTEISIRDDDGNELPLGQAGEICIRGPQVMAGYWQRPEETAKVMTADGFFRSGDIGIMDEKGYMRIVDRKKDMILVSGFNVYPNEIEGVVMMLPGVLECAAVGVPDEHSSEAVKLFVVRKDPISRRRKICAALPPEPDRLQVSEVHRVQDRTAQDQRRQDPAARTARQSLAKERPSGPPSS